MTDDETSVASVLQRDFDRTFAEPERTAPETPERYLAIELGEGSYAVRLRDVSALTASRRIVALPGADRELRGLIGHRGALVPVFDLAVLLGHAPCEDPRWLVLAGSTDLVALAVAGIAGQFESKGSGLRAMETGAQQRHVDGIVEGTPRRAVINVGSVLGAITKRGP